jgi:hypothetical protein
VDEDDFQDIRSRITAAISAMRVLRQFSYYGGLEFTADKRERLRSIIREKHDDLSDPAVNALIDNTLLAVENLIISDGVDIDNALKQLVSVSQCAVALASAWEGLDHNLKTALRHQLYGTLAVASYAPDADEILKNGVRFKGMAEVLDNDLRRLASEAINRVISKRTFTRRI